jgi:homoaconitase
MSEERRPRSRFDSDDGDRPTRSRFDTDRRSRSPSRKEPESHRARSPIAREGTESPAAASIKNKAAAAAAAAAARINAQIQAKKGIQHVEVPPIRAVSLPQKVCTFDSLTLPGADSSRQVACFQLRRGRQRGHVPARR